MLAEGLKKRNLSASSYFNTITFLCLFVLLVLCFLSELQWVSFLSVGIFAGYIIYVASTQSLFLIKYFYVIFGIILNIIGCFACEFTEVNLYELQKISFFVGSLPVLVTANIFLICSLYFFDKKWNIENKTIHDTNFFKINLIDYASILVLVTCSILFIRIIDAPSFVLGVDRFTYRDLYFGGIWDNIITALQYLIAFPLISIKRGKKSIGIAAIAVYFIFLFWAGYKYGAFLHVFILAVLVFYSSLVKLENRKLKKVISAIALCITVLVCFAVFAYSFTSTRTAEEYIALRTAQQGQLWWSIYGEYQGGDGLSSFDNEFDALIEGWKPAEEAVGLQYGMYGAMYLSAPQSVVDKKLSTGSLYTEAGFAMAYYYGGYVGVVLFSIVIAALTSAVINLLILFMNLNSILGTIIMTRFYLIASVVQSNFAFARLFGVTSLVCVAMMLALWWFYKPKVDKSELIKEPNYNNRYGL